VCIQGDVRRLVDLTNRRLRLNSGCSRLAKRRLNNGCNRLVRRWLNNGCSRLAERQLRIFNRLARSSVF